MASLALLKMFLCTLARGHVKSPRCLCTNVPVQLRNVSQVQAVGMETLAVVFKFSFFLIYLHFPRRITITQTVMVPWVHKPALYLSYL